MAYLLSCPGLSLTKVINDSGFPNCLRIVFTTSKFVLSECPPRLYTSPILPSLNIKSTPTL